MTIIEYRKVTFDAIYIKANHEWVSLYWLESTGRVIINSSFGDWSFSWPHRDNRTLAAFLVDLDMDYMGRKMLGGNYCVFSRTNTVEGIRKYILETRYQGALTKDRAREAWNNFVLLEDGDISFETWCSMESVLGEPYDFYRTEPDHSWQHFWNKLWQPYVVPALQQLINKEVICTET